MTINRQIQTVVRTVLSRRSRNTDLFSLDRARVARGVHRGSVRAPGPLLLDPFLHVSDVTVPVERSTSICMYINHVRMYALVQPQATGRSNQ
jgi:hypothetical protein